MFLKQEHDLFVLCSISIVLPNTAQYFWLCGAPENQLRGARMCSFLSPAPEYQKRGAELCFSRRSGVELCVYALITLIMLIEAVVIILTRCHRITLYIREVCSPALSRAGQLPFL